MGTVQQCVPHHKSSCQQGTNVRYQPLGHDPLNITTVLPMFTGSLQTFSFFSMSLSAAMHLSALSTIAAVISLPFLAAATPVLSPKGISIPLSKSTSKSYFGLRRSRTDLQRPTPQVKDDVNIRLSFDCHPGGAKQYAFSRPTLRFKSQLALIYRPRVAFLACIGLMSKSHGVLSVRPLVSFCFDKS